MDNGTISARVMPGRVDGRQIDAGVRAGFVETGLVMVGERRTVTGLCRPTAQAGEGARRVRLVPRPQPAGRRRRDAEASGQRRCRGHFPSRGESSQRRRQRCPHLR